MIVADGLVSPPLATSRARSTFALTVVAMLLGAAVYSLITGACVAYDDDGPELTQVELLQ